MRVREHRGGAGPGGDVGGGVQEQEQLLLQRRRHPLQQKGKEKHKTSPPHFIEIKFEGPDCRLFCRSLIIMGRAAL